MNDKLQLLTQLIIKQEFKEKHFQHVLNSKLKFYMSECMQKISLYLSSRDAVDYENLQDFSTIRLSCEVCTNPEIIINPTFKEQIEKIYKKQYNALKSVQSIFENFSFSENNEELIRLLINSMSFNLKMLLDIANIKEVTHNDKPRRITTPPSEKSPTKS